MQQIDILQKRNQLIYISLIISITTHLFTLLFGLFTFPLSNLIINLVILICLSTMFYLKVSPKLFQYSLLVCWHIFLFMLTYQSENIVTLYWFLYFLILLSIYRSLRLNIIFSIIVITESLFLLNFSHLTLKNTNEIDGLLYLFFLLLVCCISILQTFYIKRLWYRMEQSTLDREFELTSKEAYLNMFFDQAEDAIAVFNLDDTIITVNPAFERLYGWAKEDCIGKTVPIVPPGIEEETAGYAQQLLLDQGLHLFETQGIKSDGTVFDIQISMSPIYNPNGQMIAVSLIFHDISYKKENEHLVLQSEKLKLVGELGAGVAHEIRNPMTVISGFVQMMNEDDSSPYQEYTKLIQKEIERIDLILSEFLVLSRPQANQFVPIHLGEALAEVAEFFQYEFQQKRITLNTSNSHANIVINGNKNQIKQVFINLFKNSIEAMEDYGTISVEFCENLKENTVLIRIKDTGSGIPPQILEQIYEPFFTTKIEGTGLGMMIINKIIKDHQGRIQIDSEQNVGTEVIISFPIMLR